MRLLIKEWLYSDGLASWSKAHAVSPQQSIDDKTNFEPRTGKKLSITVLEGQNLSVPKSGKCDPYVKLQYGKVGIFSDASCIELNCILVRTLFPMQGRRSNTVSFDSP